MKPKEAKQQMLPQIFQKITIYPKHFLYPPNDGARRTAQNTYKEPD